jgi:hypothetical protein
LRRFAVTLRLADSPALRREAAQPTPKCHTRKLRTLTNSFQDLTKTIYRTQPVQSQCERHKHALGSIRPEQHNFARTRKVLTLLRTYFVDNVTTSGNTLKPLALRSVSGMDLFSPTRPRVASKSKPLFSKLRICAEGQSPPESVRGCAAKQSACRWLLPWPKNFARFARVVFNAAGPHAGPDPHQRIYPLDSFRPFEQASALDPTLQPCTRLQTSALRTIPSSGSLARAGFPTALQILEHPMQVVLVTRRHTIPGPRLLIPGQLLTRDFRLHFSGAGATH